MKTLSNYPNKTYLGKVNGKSIYLTAPSWDCGWYWGFGYLGNKDCHYHVDGLCKNKNLHDALIEHFNDDFILRKSDIWTFAELFSTFYKLKETAEVLGRGGSHYTTNPCKDIIINKEEVERINNIVLPQIFEEIYKILSRNNNNNELYKIIVNLNIQGDTQKVVEFLKENNFTPDDLKQIKEITKDDYHNIHSYYWRDYHKNK